MISLTNCFKPKQVAHPDSAVSICLATVRAVWGIQNNARKKAFPTFFSSTCYVKTK